ncbi:MAG: PAS domain-containing sensor histidine kinase [Candidatus Hydrogenedentes bacterium]|nr:PAS domain-containing sensor histidine kinase [Candidatus Hydrogenedentota bacterium]
MKTTAPPMPVTGVLELVDRTTAMMYLADANPARSLRKISATLAATLGHATPASTVLPEVWKKHLHPGDSSAVFERWNGPTKGKPDTSLDYRLVDTAGQVRWVREESTLVDLPGEREPKVLAWLVDITDSRNAESQMRSYAHDLAERVKELDCLYSITHLAEEGTVADVLRRVAHILPRAWQYPDRAYARIVYAGQEFVTGKNSNGYWKQAANITIRGETVGQVEVGYRETREGDANPFLPEEWSLLNGIARRLADVVERRSAEEALHRSEELYRTLARNIPGALVGLFDAELRCSLVEGKLKGVLSKRAVEGRSLEEAWGRKADFLVRMCRAALNGLDQLEEHQWRGLSLSAHVLPVYSDPATQAGVFVIHDVTDRRRLEKEVVEIAAREQRRVGQDLHDGLGQLLTGLMCLSGSLARNLSEQSPACAAQAGEITQIAGSALAEVRSLARGLMPVELDLRGLPASLQELAYDCENLFNVACECECSGEIEFDDAVAPLQLYRIAQEAVSNAVRHGKAKEIHIALKAAGSRGQLTIEDNGTGFTRSKQRRGGMGLRIMRYRAEMIGGALDIRVSRGRGTRILCGFALRKRSCAG